MTPTEIRRRILSQATEDLTGLWELPATPGALGFDELVTERSGLIGEEMITIYAGTNFASEEIALPVSDALTAIRDPRFWNWSAPEHGPHLRALAKPAGRAWYMSEPMVQLAY
jgi:hypothetical protein